MAGNSSYSGAPEPGPSARTIRITLTRRRLAAWQVTGNIVRPFAARGALSMTMERIATFAEIIDAVAP
jgi:hypothetical protein